MTRTYSGSICGEWVGKKYPLETEDKAIAWMREGKQPNPRIMMGLRRVDVSEDGKPIGELRLDGSIDDWSDQ